MKNTQQELGPLPTEQADALPPGRAAVLAAVGAQRGATLRVLAEAIELHPNTVREHLESLAASGHVRRDRVSSGGRGRPPWRYEAVPRSAPDVEPAGLAAALVAHVRRTSTDVRADAVAAGASWGRRLAHSSVSEDDVTDPVRHEGRAVRAGAGDNRTGHDRLVRLLDQAGFGPVAAPTGGTVRLTRCPLLELALADPEVVCSVHLGLVRGALAELGAPDPDGAELESFAEPGACRLELAAAGNTS